jgi:hypothetical protein
MRVSWQHLHTGTRRNSDQATTDNTAVSDVAICVDSHRQCHSRTFHGWLERKASYEPNICARLTRKVNRLRWFLIFFKVELDVGSIAFDLVTNQQPEWIATSCNGAVFVDNYSGTETLVGALGAGAGPRRKKGLLSGDLGDTCAGPPAVRG